MQVSEKTIQIADCVAQVLEGEKCTVDEAKEILSYIISISGVQSTVQIRGIISELHSEFLKAGLTGVH